MAKDTSREARQRRHLRVRAKVKGTASSPRLCVFRSLNHIYAQVIDDERGHTLVAASTLDAEVKDAVAGKKKIATSELVGSLGGKRLSFSALVVTGDGNGHVGIGLGKANEVPVAITKANAIARRNLIKVSLAGSSIPYETKVKFGAAEVLLKPAAP